MAAGTSSLKQYLEHYEAHPLFRTLPEAARNSLFAEGQVLSFAPGEALIRENEANASLYLLVEGRASVIMNKTPVAELGAGDIAGEISSAKLSPPIASVIAETAVVAIAFPVEEVRKLALENEAFAGTMRSIGRKRVSG